MAAIDISYSEYAQLSTVLVYVLENKIKRMGILYNVNKPYPMASLPLCHKT